MTPINNYWRCLRMLARAQGLTLGVPESPFNVVDIEGSLGKPDDESSANRLSIWPAAPWPCVY